MTFLRLRLGSMPENLLMASVPAQHLSGVQEPGVAALHVLQRDPDPLDLHLPVQALPGHQISQGAAPSLQVPVACHLFILRVLTT